MENLIRTTNDSSSFLLLLDSEALMWDVYRVSHVNTTSKWEDWEFYIYLPAPGGLCLFTRTRSRVGSQKKKVCHQSAKVVKRKSNLLQ